MALRPLLPQLLRGPRTGPGTGRRQTGGAKGLLCGRLRYCGESGCGHQYGGAIVDGIGCSMYGAMTFRDGVPQQSNFDTYRPIRFSEAPQTIDVHFVQNEIDPTGMGEPPFPPVIGALANALYKATGKRYYHQPFITDELKLG